MLDYFMGKTSKKKRTRADTSTAKQGDLRVKTIDHSPKAPASHIHVIILLSFTVYFNALLNGFVYDDTYQVLRNPWIRDISNIPEIFSTSVWSFLKESIHTNYYRPVMHMLYMFNYYIFGLNPWGFHLVNILFHIGTSLVIFLIALRLFREYHPSSPRSILSPSLFAALLFAAHPIHTEAVTWVAGLPDISFALFSLLSFYFYMRYKEGLKSGYALSLVSFSIAVLCKEPALTLPFILAAYDWTFRKGNVPFIQLFKRYIPYGVVAGIYLVVRFSVLGGVAPIKSYSELTIPQLFINIFPLFSRYVQKLLFPINLNVWEVFLPIASLLEIRGILSLAITSVFVLFCVVAYKNDRRVFLFLLLIVIPLLPAFYIKGIGGSLFAERYLYLPSFGFTLLSAHLLAWARSKMPRAALGITSAFIALAALYSIGTVSRNTVWKENYTLFADAVKKSPEGIEARNELGNALVGKRRFDEAIQQFEMVLRLKPNEDAHNNLGNIYLNKGDSGKAIGHFQAALKLNPNFSEALSNLAVAQGSKDATDEAIRNFQIVLDRNPSDAAVHSNMGDVYLKKGMVDEAIEHFQSALKLDQNLAEVHDQLGVAYYKQGRLNEAIQEYTTFLRLRPDNPITQKNLGDAYYDQGRLDKAAEEYRRAIRLRPSFALAHESLGNVFLRQNRFDDAAYEYLAAIRLKPDLPQSHSNLGSIYLSQGQLDNALKEYQTALRINPALADLYFNLGIVYMKKGLKNEARKSFEKLLTLKPNDAQARRALESIAH
ncbi:MAG: repeat-containing protein [Deltaproteobacteria bacterium]|nr:repeat-containing protein [Deltaproteobacteria bacterium]